MTNQNDQLGVLDPVSAVSFGTSVIKSLFKNKYAEAESAIIQVNRFAEGNAQSVDGLKALSTSIGSAYATTIASTRDKVNQLRRIESGNADNKTVRNIAIVTIVVAAAGIVIDKFV